jgi:hypothetical protein
LEIGFKGKNMPQTTSTLILAVITVLIFSKNADANNWSILDIYDDTAPLLIPESNSIDLTFKELSLPDYRDREKTLGSSLGEFTKDSLAVYTFIWMGRVYLSPENGRRLFTTPPPKYLKNTTRWQSCRGMKIKKGLCYSKKGSFRNPPLLDGDSFETNFIHHPFVGMSYYLYYRARGYCRITSAFGSFLQSALFEYTIEACQQPPSFNDLILTPGIGVPVGIVVEEISNWLAERDSQFLVALSYIVNPTRVLVPEGRVAWQNFRGIGFRFNWL